MFSSNRLYFFVFYVYLVAPIQFGDDAETVN